MSEPKLLPCVYCESKDVVIHKGVLGDFSLCKHCESRGPTAQGKEEAARLHNTRTVNVQGD